MKTAQEPHLISRLLCSWYAENRRELPWRNTRDPYHIWLSEIILQQTRIQQGLPYYFRFLAHFPDVFALAAADEALVLKLWQGLGYYSRARNLHQTAKTIVHDYRGVFPDNLKELQKLKGIGLYTASAIASFAFDLPVPVLDGNVYRVLARLYNIDLNVLDKKSEPYFLELAQECMDPEQAATHNQAMMDFGATCCTPQQPKCDDCPLQDHCLAWAENCVGERPVRLKENLRKNRYFHYLCLHSEDVFWMKQRLEKDIWQHLWEFPLIETPQAIEDWNQLYQQHAEFITPLLGKQAIASPAVRFVHQLSHQTIHATFYPIAIASDAIEVLSNTYQAISLNQLEHTAVSRLTDRFLKKQFQLSSPDASQE